MRLPLPNTHPSCLTLLSLFLLTSQTQALVTLATIRSLTNVTNDCRGLITDKGNVLSNSGGGEEIDPMVAVLGGGGVGGGQVVLSGDEIDEVEETVAAALRMLCSDLLVELEEPLLETFSQPFHSDTCTVAKEEFHSFLEATVKFLHEIQERQMRWRWGGDSAVYDGIAWLQGLWASRKANIQERSFIEQQMSLYASTGCFGKSQEVLRRNVEVVEYLNDLMDEFQ